MKRIIFISSTGGHLTELLCLKDMFKEYDYSLITEKTYANMGLRNQFGEKRVHFLVYGTKSHLFSYIFRFLYNCLKSLVLFAKIRPDVVITTGTHTAVPMCMIAHLFGKKVVWIETFANSQTGTAAGKMVYPIADLFIVQWETMLDVYPNAVYRGWIF